MHRLSQIVRFVSFAIFIFAAFSLFAPKAEAAISDWQKSVSVYPHSQGDFEGEQFKRTVDKLKDMGADTVTFIIPMYQSTVSSSDIGPGGDTPSDQALISGVQYVHSKGMKAVLKPHLEYAEVEGWRAYIKAENRDEWYKNYGAMLDHLGDIGKQTQAEGIIIGTELISMASDLVNPDNTLRWNQMIASLRARYDGWLTYDANWSWGNPRFEHEVESIKFWPALDFIGISAYYPVAQDVAEPTVEEIKQSWKYWDDTQLRRLSQTYAKKLLFTEIGYKSVEGAHKAPCCSPSQDYDALDQSNAYQGLFEYWNDSPYMAGVHLWYWDVDPNYGGAGNIDYTAEGKPAWNVIKSAFGGGTNQNPPTTTPPLTGPDGGSSTSTSNGTTTDPSALDIDVIVESEGLVLNSPITIKATISSSGWTENSVVDVEIFDSSGNRMHQQLFAGQNLAKGIQSYVFNWTPTSPGVYFVKVGVFSSDWKVNYVWIENARILDIKDNTVTTTTDPTGNVSTSTDAGAGTATSTVDQSISTSTGSVSTTTSTTERGELDIWWPTNGVTIHGLQPVKGMVEGMNLDQYDMYWQVDGDRLNPMYDSDVDWPHKEAYIELSGWTWRDQGPYHFTFIVKDKSGKTIIDMSVDIFVVQI